ncbi:hypothetical protein ACH3VR_00615 [Microbacterium sp. B2969]|uniref:Sugar ABC transporter ATPase n=1 Tax=Microbacterium alkaliflavum TaxID=3248839 RepID=A0ABW7Q3A4_9MICO
MRHDKDLPEGVVDADPAGGWEDRRAADGETSERSDQQSEDLMADGWVADIPVAANAAGGTDVGSVEGDGPTQGADPDLATDQGEEG